MCVYTNDFDVYRCRFAYKHFLFKSNVFGTQRNSKHLLCVGTCVIFEMIEHWPLQFQIRRALGDFGVPIAIVIMVGIDMAFPSVFTQKLNVPEGLHVTAPEKRDWFISPMGIRDTVPVWIPFISVLPAILLYLLIFMETSICE